MTDPIAWADDALAELDARGLRRVLRHHGAAAAEKLHVEGRPRPVLNLSGNSYLGLAHDQRVVAAAQKAADQFGVGAGASRLVTGGTTAHRDLEHALAAFKRTEAAALFSSGYLANLGVLTVLAGRGDTIVSDERNHASIIDACRLSGAEVRVFRHADPEHAETLLRDAPGRRVLVTDGVFSMDGDLAPLPDLCDVAERHGAAVVVDDAHGTGVLGPDGRGTVAATGCEGRVHAIVVTLSKALGSVGGAVVGQRRLVELVHSRARPFIFDTALPAMAVAAAHAALELSVEEPWRRDVATRHARTLAAAARDAGGSVPEVETCIVPVVLGSNAAALDGMERLLADDILAVAIRPPSVAPGSARLRLTTMATHEDEDMARAAQALARVVPSTDEPTA